jgi:hypothetical protein
MQSKTKVKPDTIKSEDKINFAKSTRGPWATSLT